MSISKLGSQSSLQLAELHPDLGAGGELPRPLPLLLAGVAITPSAGVANTAHTTTTPFLQLGHEQHTLETCYIGDLLQPLATLPGGGHQQPQQAEEDTGGPHGGTAGHTAMVIN